MMYVRQARPLGCRGWEAVRRKVEKDEKDGGLPGTKGVGRRARCRGGVERAPAYTLRIIYWHWIYLKLCYTEAAIVLLRRSRSSLPLLPAIALTPCYDRVDLLPSPALSSSLPSLAPSPLLIPAVSFSFPLPMTPCASSARLAAITLGRSLRNI